jgi:dolichol kinase
MTSAIPKVRAISGIKKMFYLLFLNLFIPLVAAILAGYQNGGMFGAAKGGAVGSFIALANYLWITRLLRWCERRERKQAAQGRPPQRPFWLAGFVAVLLCGWNVVNGVVIFLLMYPDVQVHLHAPHH